MLRISLLSMAICLAGCGGATKVNVAKPTVDVATARNSLKQSLDAWKEGKQPADLATGASPVSVSDLQWAGGAKLLDYEIVNEGDPRGPALVAVVKLKMSKPDGTLTETTAKYIVNTIDGKVSIYRVKSSMM